MPTVEINYLAVVVAAAASMVVGAIWYSPLLFAKPWQELVGIKTDAVQSGASMAMVIAAIAGLLTAFVLRHFVVYAGANTWQEGAIVGFWVWLGFVVTTLLVHNAFEQRRKKLFLINAGHHFVELITMGIILTLWV